MANFVALTIPLSKIEKIEIYINSKKKQMSQIKKETGADYLLNGTLYDMKSGKVCCHLKADNKVWGNPDYTVSGYSWQDGPDISMDVLPDSSVANYIGCTPLIVSGKALSKLTYDPGQGGIRGRSAIGIKGDRLALYCTKDGSSAARTPEKLRDDLFAAGWESAIMLDGGGSSQCDFAGQRVNSSRAVQNLILVYLKKAKPAPDTNVGSTNQQKRDRVLSWAESQLGVIEFPYGSNKVKYNDWYYGHSGCNYAWCVTFVQWVFDRAGLPLPIKTASCTQLANYAKRHGQWVTSGYKPGDVLMFHWGSDRSVTEHTGILKEIHGNQLVVIEGNTSTRDQSNGGCVMERTRALVSVTGAYRPWYNF